MEYIELYKFVKKEVEGMEFRRFKMLVYAAVFVAVFAVFFVQLPDLMLALK